MGMRHRVDIRFRMELGDQLCRLLVDEGVCPATIRDIQADHMLMNLWWDILHDMMSLMCHIIGASRLLAVRRDRHHGDAPHNKSDDDHGGVIILVLHLLLLHISEMRI